MIDPSWSWRQILVISSSVCVIAWHLASWPHRKRSEKMEVTRPRLSLIYRSEPSTSDNNDDERAIQKFPASGLLCCAPFIISTAALALSFIASATCDLVTLENTDFFPLPARSAGLWCFTTLGGSTASSANIPLDIDGARGCGTATLILGIIVWLYYCFAACCPFTCILFRIVAFLCLCNTVLQGLVFLVLQSNMCSLGCGLDAAGYCAIAAAILWFLAGMLSCVAGKPVEVIEESEIEGDEQEEANEQEPSASEKDSNNDNDEDAIQEENTQEQLAPNEADEGTESKE